MEVEETVTDPVFKEDNMEVCVEAKVEEKVEEKESEPPNRRCTLRPRKRSFDWNNSSSPTVEPEHNPRKKRKITVHRELETIFEEPVAGKDGNILLIGAKKAKRYITFSEFVTKTKKKKRKAKVRKLKLGKPDESKRRRNLLVQEVEGQMTQLGI